jgi:hypothetical protein
MKLRSSRTVLQYKVNPETRNFRQLEALHLEQEPINIQLRLYERDVMLLPGTHNQWKDDLLCTTCRSWLYCWQDS